MLLLQALYRAEPPLLLHSLLRIWALLCGAGVLAHGQSRCVGTLAELGRGLTAGHGRTTGWLACTRNCHRGRRAAPEGPAATVALTAAVHAVSLERHREAWHCVP